MQYLNYGVSGLNVVFYGNCLNSQNKCSRVIFNNNNATHLTAFVRDYEAEPVPERILLNQETVRGNGISWAICKSASRRRQIPTPASHHSNFYRPDVLPVS